MAYREKLKTAFDLLMQRRMKPRPWTDGASLPWQERDFSQSFLEAEELPELASKGEARFLLERFSGGPILEIACGAGRTAKELFRVRPEIDFTGLDIGPYPLELARDRCPKGKFVRADMRKLPFFGKTFSLVFCVYGGFLGLKRREAHRLMDSLASILLPGGLLLLEFPSESFLSSIDGLQEWWVSESSFAGDFPQLGLSENFYYHENRIYMRRDFVFDLENASIREFTQSNCVYNEFEIRSLLESHGFLVLSIHGTWDGRSLEADSERLILLASTKN